MYTAQGFEDKDVPVLCHNIVSISSESAGDKLVVFGVAGIG
jgi:hypothetical protein